MGFKGWLLFYDPQKTMLQVWAEIYKSQQYQWLVSQSTAVTESIVAALLDTLKQFLSLEKDAFRNYPGDNWFVSEASEVGVSFPSPLLPL